QNAVHFVGDLRQALDELVMVDGEARLERGQLLEQTAPFVEAAHALHEQALTRQLDDVAAVAYRGPELDVEGALVPHHQAIDCVLAFEPPELRIDDLVVLEVKLGGLAVAAAHPNTSGLAANLDGLNEIDDTHVGDVACEFRARVTALERLL